MLLFFKVNVSPHAIQSSPVLFFNACLAVADYGLVEDLFKVRELKSLLL